MTNIDIITSHARKADIITKAASSDDVTLSNAVLAGHKVCIAEDKQPASPLDTTGVAVWICKKLIFGEQDESEADLRAIARQMLHTQVDYLTGLNPPMYFFYFMTQDALKFKKAVHIGEGPNVSYTALLEDLIDLLFTRIQGHEDAKASLHIMAVFACVLKSNGNLEDAKASSISVRVVMVLCHEELTLEEGYAVQAGSWREDEDSTTNLISLPLERGISADDDNTKPQLTNDGIRALPLGVEREVMMAEPACIPVLPYVHDTLGVRLESFVAHIGANDARSIKQFSTLGLCVRRGQELGRRSK
ncbi:hypothetical protein EI94DRAFT_1804275 [Lactarius quietus]|nr:hypothetical protein EI94DRAFT_1804275 [Lactarius quietus]